MKKKKSMSVGKIVLSGFVGTDVDRLTAARVLLVSFKDVRGQHGALVGAGLTVGQPLTITIEGK